MPLIFWQACHPQHLRAQAGQRRHYYKSGDIECAWMCRDVLKGLELLVEATGSMSQKKKNHQTPSKMESYEQKHLLWETALKFFQVWVLFLCRMLPMMLIHDCNRCWIFNWSSTHRASIWWPAAFSVVLDRAFAWDKNMVDRNLNISDRLVKTILPTLLRGSSQTYRKLKLPCVQNEFPPILACLLLIKTAPQHTRKHDCPEDAYQCTSFMRVLTTSCLFRRAA